MKKQGLCILAASVLAVLCAFSGCKGSTDTTETSETTEVTLTKITVTGGKKTYYVGHGFTTSGLVIKAYYSDSSKKTVSASDCTFTCDGTTFQEGTEFTSSGSKTMNVTYGEASKSFIITVKGKYTDYTNPTFDVATVKDDYTSIASWSNNKQWNLANVHDPTVVYWPSDGYYYMWGTDASYGNEALNSDCGKHFSGKRSKDLISWEYVPGPFDDCPEWVNEKLNSIREAMGLSDIDMSTDENAEKIGYWAPCARVITVDGTTKIRMYYSIVCDYMIGSGKPNTTANFDNTWSERAMIGVCETTDPSAGPAGWNDLGFVTCSSSDKGTDYSRSSTDDWDAYFYFNAIDPTYFIDDDGTHWMIYGSWHSGFALVQINPSTGKITKDGSTDFAMGNPWADSAAGLATNGYGTRIYTRNASSRWQGSEGPELVKYNGYYYLFFANDGLAVPYQTRVVRAESITGPYYDIDGKDVTAGTATKNPLPVITHPYIFDGDSDTGYGWVGFSHCAVFQDTDGNWFYMSQARFPENVGGNEYSNALMVGHVRRIEWCKTAVSVSDTTTDLWPMVLPERYAGLDVLEANELTGSDIAGTWEHINLNYSYGKQDTCTETVFTQSDSDKNAGTVTGGVSGSWSFDPATNLLTIGTRVVKVQREMDWEASSRKTTLVYTGIGASSSTYWGKKVEDAYATYADKYANATLKATYTMTVSDTGKDDLAWYLYPQWGTYTLVAQNGSSDTETTYASVSGTNAWWTGTSENHSTSFTVADGKTLTMYTTGSTTLILEAYSSSANEYVDINPHDTDDGWDTDQDKSLVTEWGSDDERTAVTANAAQNLKITITRSGNTEVLKIYQL